MFQASEWASHSPSQSNSLGAKSHSALTADKWLPRSMLPTPRCHMFGWLKTGALQSAEVQSIFKLMSRRVPIKMQLVSTSPCSLSMCARCQQKSIAKDPSQYLHEIVWQRTPGGQIQSKSKPYLYDSMILIHSIYSWWHHCMLTNFQQSRI